MIYEWKLNGATRNLGDSLGELLATPEQVKDEINVYALVGSVICDFVMDECLRQGQRPVFIDCGWRGEPLSQEMVDQCKFIGSRGPDTQEALRGYGVDVEVTKDAGYKIPSVVIKAEYSGEVISIPHIEDTATLQMNPLDLGVSRALAPIVTDKKSIIDLVKIISSADFVLAGAMHAAILAHAYGVRFAPLSTGYVNCLPKWEDWAKSVGIENLEFVNNCNDGLNWYSKEVNQNAF